MQCEKVPVIRIQRNNQQGAMPQIGNVLLVLLIKKLFSSTKNKHRIDRQTYSLSY